ncbi:MAG TPA: YifB family Mg chelatase-like AAA ATPase [Treponemataceae bacterium]|nr:YifB family Mg chelatase-like AAA ATPase [Treponemataceae bacterium]
MEIYCFSPFGYAGELIKVEADLRRGIPSIDIVGLPDGAVRESRERMRAAIRNAGLEFPLERILINLSPAGLRKEGSGFDLPIALAVLVASNGLGTGPDEGAALVVGELELSGRVRGARGILAAVTLARKNGITLCLVPRENEEEARLAGSGSIAGVSSLSEAFHCLLAGSAKLAYAPDAGEPDRAMAPNSRSAAEGAIRWPSEPGADLATVRGQPTLLRALEIAAAGGHHLLAYGAPGSGKTLALSRFSALLPLLDEETALVVTRIHSIAGLTGPDRHPDALVSNAPFRSPHQGASLEGMAGGGRACVPGEMSLAHGGVLFLDEAHLFRGPVIQSLRGPLETGRVAVSRAGRSSVFPARFQLLLALNPCPCGNFGIPDRTCVCLPEAIERHWRRFTAPLLDRIDLRIEVRPPDPERLIEEAEIPLADARARIARALAAQRERQMDEVPPAERDVGGCPWKNGFLPPEGIARHCVLRGRAKEVFVRGSRAQCLSGRGAHGVLRVARTIADLAGRAEISVDDVEEALGLRRWAGALADFL